ncbi:MAG: type II toxin-antitoxin system HipA family toxin [Desulfobulbaceae bacterium]|nr:type II toxin-antitoxin system HipA family toxin [Desulfobulbaceae bacterium]
MNKNEVSLYVFAVMPDGEIVRVGRLLSRNLRSASAKEGFFRYDEGYLGRRDVYAIDPRHLPLTDPAGIHSAARGEAGVHAVFEDSLPDAWGRTILAKRAGLDKTSFAPAHLLEALGGGGLGRLLYFPTERSAMARCRDGSIAFDKIRIALDEAGRLEKDIDTENRELKHLLACGSSAGGARPKILTRHDGRLWLAKFSSVRDLHPSLLVSLEQAGMELAKRAGLDVPEVRKVTVSGRELLLVERFDVTDEGGRNALVSMRTLTGQEDPYLASYADMAAVIREISVQPEKDLELLFRWMAVNILVQNTDDHLQNFSMLHTMEGWRLSPAYDITPNIYQREQILRVNGKDEALRYGDIVAEGKRFGFSLQKGRKLFGEIYEATSVWEHVFDTCGVPPEHTRELRKSIAGKRRFFAPDR